MKTIETTFSTLTLDDDGLVTARPVDPNQPRTAEVIGEIVERLIELVGGEPRPALWIPGTAQMAPNGWQVLIERVDRFATAVAIVVTNADDHGLGAFPGTVDSLLLPVRIFGDEETARQWLLSQVDSPASPS